VESKGSVIGERVSGNEIAEKINSSFEFFFKKWDNIYFQNEEKQV
jgi:hypothetical protein